jgi:hypothetical protein
MESLDFDDFGDDIGEGKKKELEAKMDTLKRQFEDKILQLTGQNSALNAQVKDVLLHLKKIEKEQEKAKNRQKREEQK